MTLIIIGNIISFIGAGLMVLIGFIKEKKNVLIAQCGQFAILGIANLVLGGVTGFISNMVSIVRNIIVIYFPFTLPLKIIFIVLQLALSIPFNTQGAIGYLPVAAAAIFTWFLDTKSDVTLKIVIILTEILWIIYDISLFNFTSMAFDIFTLISNGIGIIMIMKSRNR